MTGSKNIGAKDTLGVYEVTYSDGRVVRLQLLASTAEKLGAAAKPLKPRNKAVAPATKD